MAVVLTQGWHVARDAGLIETGCDIRIAVGCSGIAVDPDDIFVDDTNLDTTEYDGTGYSRYAPTGVTWAYDATANEMQLDCNDSTTAFGAAPVAAATTAPEAFVYILQVGGSPDPAVDYVLGKDDAASLGNGNGGSLGYTAPAGGFLYSKQA
jgi:hypothetical protein